MKKYIYLLVIGLFALTGCGGAAASAKPADANAPAETYKVEKNVTYFDGTVVPEQTYSYPLDPDAKINVKSNQKVTPDTLLYSVPVKDSEQMLTTYQNDLKYAREDLAAVNAKIAATTADDPTLPDLQAQKRAAERGISKAQGDINGLKTTNNFYAKFNGEVFVNDVKIKLISDTLNIKLNCTLETLKTVLNTTNLVAEMNGKEYPISLIGYQPIESDAGATSYSVLYKIDAPTDGVIVQQSVKLKTEDNKKFIPNSYVTTVNDKKYTKINGTTTEITGTESGARFEVTSSLEYGSTIEKVSENDDIHKQAK